MRLMTLRMIGAPRAEAGIIPLNEAGLSLVVVKVKDPIAVEAIAVDDVHELMALVLRKALGNLGVARVGEYETDLIVRLDPQVQPSRRAKVQRHSGLFQVSHRLGDPRVRPIVQLVLVTVDVQREGLFDHVKRVRRTWRRRWRLAQMRRN